MTEGCEGWHKSEGISIHTFLAEGDQDMLDENGKPKISIHTFLAEGDALRTVKGELQLLISIHTFLAEGDERGCRLQ